MLLNVRMRRTGETPALTGQSQFQFGGAAQGREPCGRLCFPFSEKGHILIKIPYALPDSIKKWSLISTLSKGCPLRLPL